MQNIWPPVEFKKELDKDHKTRVIIIEGSGKGFSAGHNLKEVKSLKGKPNYKKLFELCSELMMVIINCNKPVIAKVHGFKLTKPPLVFGSIESTNN